MASDVPNTFGSSEEWATHLRGGDASGPNNTNYLGFPIPDHPTSHGRHPFDSEIRQRKTSFEVGEVAHETLAGSLPDFAEVSHEGDGNQYSTSSQLAPVQFTQPPSYILQAAFTSSNSRSPSSQESYTISPLQTSFGSSNTAFSTDTTAYFGMSSNFILNGMSMGGENHVFDSQTIDFHAESPTQRSPTRGRRSQDVEPGSARAVYLEKNRKAATKCRTKQKKQQDELVETARDAERMNKVLKAEVEILKGDMRELMGIVGQHSDCPDTRLRTYVQREADRLAAQGPNSPVTELLRPRKSASLEHEQGEND